MSAPALGAITAGTRYQVRHFWLHALAMLVRPGIERVAMELPDADGVDDVGIFYAAPGKNDGGDFTDADLLQIKFHVDQRGTIDADFFTDPKRTKTARPLLRRLADTWSAQRARYPRCRITFITNWNWDTTDHLRPLLTASDVLGEEFFTRPATSEVGKVREKWLATSGLGLDDFNAFIRRLRFQLPFSTERMEEHLRDRMQAANLVVPPLDHECNTLDDFGKRFLETGRTDWTSDTLRTTLQNENLFASSPLVRRPVVSVRSFTRFAGLDLLPGDVDIDLSDLFVGRHPLRPDVWTKDIPERLEARLAEIAKLQQPIELALDCHLSIAWYLGNLLGPKSGLSILLRQKGIGRGTEIWDPIPPTGTADEWTMPVTVVGTGDNLAVAVSLTNVTDTDVKRSQSVLGLDAARYAHLLHPQAGHGAVKDGPHAASLAASLADRVRTLANDNSSVKTHLFLSVPVAVAFLLGQRSGTLGPSTAYEFDFQGTKTYAPGMSSPKP